MDGERGPRRLTGPRTERISDSKTWLPSSTPRRQRLGAGRGRGRNWVAAGPSSHLPPPGLALAGSQRPVPPSWPRLSSSSLPGHTAEAGAARLLRVPPRPTVERGGRARERSMRSGRAAAWGERCSQSPRSLSRCSSPQEYAVPSPCHLGSTPGSEWVGLLHSPGTYTLSPGAVLCALTRSRGHEFPKPKPLKQGFGLVEPLYLLIKIAHLCVGLNT